MTDLDIRMDSLLASRVGERRMHSFLKDHPIIVEDVFARAWNEVMCLPEFSLGMDFRTDFTVLSADSGRWHVAFVELEPPNCRLYLKDGTPAKRLRIAQRQVADWRNFVRGKEDALRHQFSMAFEQDKTPAQCSHADRHTWASTEICDRRTVVYYYYHIVIGRRAALSPEEQERRATEAFSWEHPEIVTYDRLLDQASRIAESQREIDARRRGT